MVKFIRLEKHDTSQCPVTSASRQQVYNGIKNVIKLHVSSAQQTLHLFPLSVAQPPDKPFASYQLHQQLGFGTPSAFMCDSVI